jgi:hypothetical protein
MAGVLRHGKDTLNRSNIEQRNIVFNGNGLPSRPLIQQTKNLPALFLCATTFVRLRFVPVLFISVLF